MKEESAWKEDVLFLAALSWRGLNTSLRVDTAHGGHEQHLSIKGVVSAETWFSERCARSPHRPYLPACTGADSHCASINRKGFFHMPWSP